MFRVSRRRIFMAKEPGIEMQKGELVTGFLEPWNNLHGNVTLYQVSLVFYSFTINSVTSIMTQNFDSLKSSEHIY